MLLEISIRYLLQWRTALEAQNMIPNQAMPVEKRPLLQSKGRLRSVSAHQVKLNAIHLNHGICTNYSIIKVKFCFNWIQFDSPQQPKILVEEALSVPHQKRGLLTTSDGYHLPLLMTPINIEIH